MGRGGGGGGGDADVNPKVMLEDLNQQARRCVRVVGLFREASLVLDEVDLILHPLKVSLLHIQSMLLHI